jgi:hypothetical protein
MAKLKICISEISFQVDAALCLCLAKRDVSRNDINRKKEKLFCLFSFLYLGMQMWD